jgi:hypothetical protein
MIASEREEMDTSKIVIGQVTPDISLELLEFDMKNPRFTPDHAPRASSDEAIIRIFHKHAELNELLLSISKNGYIDIEPLVVIKKQREDKLIVLEGNRRLAALRLFTNDELGSRLGITVPAIQSDKRDSIHSVSVMRVSNREAARTFIGFKHINGPQRWDAISKAKYATEWYLQEKEAGSEFDLADIARSMGDSHATIRRLVNGYLALRQAEDWGLFQIEGRYPGKKFGFSHFYTALTKPEYQRFLGLERNWMSDQPSSTPVPENKKSELVELLTWLYGSKADSIKPVIKSQNPHVRNLGKVISDPVALTNLRKSRDLDSAYEELTPPGTKFAEAFLQARELAKIALAHVRSGFTGEKEYGPRADEFADDAVQLRDNMKTIIAQHNKGD